MVRMEYVLLLVQRFIPYLEREDDETELSLNSCD